MSFTRLSPLLNIDKMYMNGSYPPVVVEEVEVPDRVKVKPSEMYPTTEMDREYINRMSLTGDYWGRNLWVAIHIIARFYDPYRGDRFEMELIKNSFKCFFVSLSKLLPCPAAQSNTQFFIKETPIEYYLANSNQAFMWTYLLHNYINTVRQSTPFGRTTLPRLTRRVQSPHREIILDAPTLEEVSIMYSPANVTKQIWGNGIWFLIHFIAINLPGRLNNQITTSFTALIVCFQSLLPCKECRDHMVEHLRNFPLKEYTQSRERIFEWTVKLHNRVNSSLSKPEMRLEDALRLYQRR